MACWVEVSPCSEPCSAAGCAQALRLSSCEQVADAGIRALCAGPAARALLELDLRDCDRLTDAAAAGIGAGLTALRALNLEHCHRISPKCAPRSPLS